MTEEVDYNQMACPELSELIDYQIDNPVDGRKKKEYRKYLENLQKMIDSYNLKTGFQAYQKVL
jgi:hypothetical protein